MNLMEYGDSESLILSTIFSLENKCSVGLVTFQNIKIFILKIRKHCGEIAERFLKKLEIY